MQEIISISLFLVLAGTKLLLAPAAMLAAGFGLVKTMIITYIGALLGAIVFYYFGVAIFKWWDNLVGNSETDKLVFNRKSRAMVSVKIRYGILGLASLSPIVSIPVTALIIAKFFPNNTKVIGIYAMVLVPISIALTLLSDPIIQPLVEWVKSIF